MALGKKDRVLVQTDIGTAGGVAPAGLVLASYRAGSNGEIETVIADAYGRLADRTEGSVVVTVAQMGLDLSAGVWHITLRRADGNYGSLTARSYYGEKRRELLGGSWSLWTDMVPDMNPEEGEYRTGEQYLGRNVYTKVIDFGALPASGTKSVYHGIEGLLNVRSVELVATNAFSDVTNYPWVSGVYSDAEMISVTTTGDLSSITANAVIRYTKTTA